MSRMRVAACAVPARLARATAIASSLTSVAQTSASGSSAASASASAPEPVPRSATRNGSGAVDHGLSRPRWAPRRTASSMATCATTSVSGRGSKTRPSTSRSMPRNDHRSRTYPNGSPFRRRLSITSKCATACRVAGSSSCKTSSVPSSPLARSTIHRASEVGAATGIADSAASARRRRSTHRGRLPCPAGCAAVMTVRSRRRVPHG